MISFYFLCSNSNYIYNFKKSFSIKQTNSVILKSHIRKKIFYHNTIVFLKILFYLFLERGERKEKERERNINVWLPLIQPHWGPGLQPRHVPWLGIEPATFWFTARTQTTELYQPEHTTILHHTLLQIFTIDFTYVYVHIYTCFYVYMHIYIQICMHIYLCIYRGYIYLNLVIFLFPSFSSVKLEYNWICVTGLLW